MDINDQLQPVVASLLDSLKVSMDQEIKDQISSEVLNKIANTELTSIVTDIINTQLNDRLAKYNLEATTNKQLDSIVAQITDQFNKTLVKNANTQISGEIMKQLSGINVKTVIEAIIETKLATLITAGSLPKAGIPHTSIDFRGVTITGDNVKGGIIENFGSIGIEDRATHVQMTLMDHATAFEGPVWAPSAAIKGTLTVDGDLILKGTISQDSPVVDQLASLTVDKINADESLLKLYSERIQENIAEIGLSLNTITQNGKEVVSGNRLGYHIVDSNLQRVGLLRDLQTTGENLLSDTLYVTTRRVGVNSIDPSATFVVWDEEVELIVTKRSQDTGYIGTSRHQSVILGSNNKENIKLLPDGTTQIDNLSVGRVPMSSTASIPNYEGTAGQIVWNEHPAPGGPIGWVCLGSTRWAKFGIIE
jgi:hypothetical protein